MKARLVKAFRWLHRHPELAMKEHKTTEYLRKTLLDSGVRLLDTKLETGLIAVIGTGEAPAIALRNCAEIIHTLCLSESAIAALSSVSVPRHASLLRLALTNSSGAFCTNNFCTVPYLKARFAP